MEVEMENNNMPNGGGGGDCGVGNGMISEEGGLGNAILEDSMDAISPSTSSSGVSSTVQARQQQQQQQHPGLEDDAPVMTDDLLLYANVDQCRNAFTLIEDIPRTVQDSGWWIIGRIKEMQLCSKFDGNSEKALTVFRTIQSILDRYYVNAESYLRRLCREVGVPEHECKTTKNERVARFRNKYATAISQGDYVCLDIPLTDFSTIVVNLNSLCVGLCLLTIRFKNPAIANNIQHSTHIPMLLPFNHSTDLLFNKLNIKPNPQFIQIIRSGGENGAVDITKTPYIFVNGYVTIICESGDSRGTNTAGKHFKVLNLAEPSLTMLRDHLNNYIRRKYPDCFPTDKISSNMFVQLSETQSTPNISCMEAHRDKRYMFVLANLANIYLVQTTRGLVIPQLQVWTNVKLCD